MSMSPLKIPLITSSAFIIAVPFCAIPFPNHFHLFSISFIHVSHRSKSLGICAFSDHHIVDLSDYVHSPNVVMQPIIQFVSLLLMSIISLLDRYRLGGSLLVRVVRHSLLQPTQLTVNSRAMEQGGQSD